MAARVEIDAAGVIRAVTITNPGGGYGVPTPTPGALKKWKRSYYAQPINWLMPDKDWKIRELWEEFRHKEELT